jgi:type III secretion protein Q
VKSTLALRSLALPEYERRHAVARWQRDGHPVRLCQAHPQTRYISFWAQGSHGIWQGMVGAREWLQAVWPQWSQLLPQGCTDQDILELFAAVNRPVETAIHLLDYQRLFELELTHEESLLRACLPCIVTAQGDVWVIGVPSHCPTVSRPLQASLQAVQQVLRIVLGSSDLGRPPHPRLAPGDVLFIAEQKRQLFMADQCIGQFTFIEEGLHMQLTPPDDASPITPSVLSVLPVKLEFVLGEFILSMAQLNELIESQVLPLEPSAVNHVEVRAGDKRIATGELVQLDGRLGVELREVYRCIGDE